MNRLSTLTVAVSVAAAALTALASCTAVSDSSTNASSNTESGSTKSSSDSTSSPQSPEQRGGTLRIGLIQDSAGLDPALTTESQAFAVDSMIYETLVNQDDEGKVTPGLAADWTISDDQLTYTFHLRKNALFSNGEALDADAVAFSINRIRTTETSPRRNLLEPISKIETPDADTVVISLETPYSPLLSNLAQMWAAIVDPSTVEKYGDVQQHPVGSGAYKLTDWKHDSSMTLKPNEHYSGGQKPKLDAVKVTFNSNASSRIASLKSGQVDLLYNVSTEQLSDLEAQPNIDLYGQGHGTSWVYLLLNMQKAPFDQLSVRQAIYTAINRDEIVTACVPGTGTPLAGGFLNAKAPGAVTKPVFTFDPVKAKRLLQESGHSEGVSLTINVLTGWDFQICTAQVVAENLNAIGIDAQLHVMELAQMNDATANHVKDGKFEAQVIGWSGTSDPDQRMSQVFSTNGGANYVGFSNDKVDSLIESARQISDPVKRAELYQKAQIIITEKGPYAFLYNYDSINAASNKVHGYKFVRTTSNFSSISDVWLSK